MRKRELPDMLHYSNKNITSGLVSVIIPVFNTKAYLDECIQSVADQTYNNLEIILIDDGSTDGSSEVCDAWAKKDLRILVIHQNNRGVSAARNTGLSESRGEWIVFLDSDDRLSAEMIRILVEKTLQEGVVSAVRITRESSNVRNQIDKVDWQIITPAELEKKRKGQFTVGILFYNQRICDNDLWFDEELKCHEDNVWNAEYFSDASKVAFADIELYYYRNVSGSLSSVRTDYYKEPRNWLRAHNSLKEYAKGKRGANKTDYINKSIRKCLNNLYAELFVYKVSLSNYLKELLPEIQERFKKTGTGLGKFFSGTEYCIYKMMFIIIKR